MSPFDHKENYKEFETKQILRGHHIEEELDGSYQADISFDVQFSK